MVVLTTLMHPAWSGVFFQRNLGPGLPRKPQHTANYWRPTKRESEIQVQTCIPDDCPTSRKKTGHFSLCTPTPVGPGGQDPGSWPWKQILLDDEEVQVGGSLGEAGRGCSAVTGVRARTSQARPKREGREDVGVGDSMLRPVSSRRGFQGKNNQPAF